MPPLHASEKTLHQMSDSAKCADTSPGTFRSFLCSKPHVVASSRTNFFRRSRFLAGLATPSSPSLDRFAVSRCLRSSALEPFSLSLVSALVYRITQGDVRNSNLSEQVRRRSNHVRLSPIRDCPPGEVTSAGEVTSQDMNTCPTVIMITCRLRT